MTASETDTYSAYDDFAWFYHRYWSQGIPFRLLEAVDQLVLADLRPGARVLDLCCGTGRISRALVERGFAVTGLDGSAGMLEIAAEEAPGAEFARADARDFSVDVPVDAVVSLFDSLNHVTGDGELARVFGCVHRALAPGGRFLFDLNDDSSFRRHWRGETFTTVEDDHASIMRGEYDADARLGTVTVTLFRLMDGSWRRSDVVVHERCYDEAEILALLRDAGFTARMHRAETDLGMDDQAGRMFFVAERV
ncbi:class I SAM-dependent DNA methyltransferase [Longimicrobium terrae]|uniref:SAM-dependent methyltransferase n=1 Tax=Longimicrobium terrae TaxID=1639882 RepID=A0A841GYB2_9BACT|nr:class I SAM-dependent methyltransferase [Longimicrobium terrae]MBB4636330.1 SAM-dependent methyltransferase [Longimicrobium terrae]MBB6070726.1 SAM-dependent methyltransferase [Longimicrobium terrae]NNC29705.1 class I SAM-dependent methyltransferase [Longimicrobium terrae]